MLKKKGSGRYAHVTIMLRPCYILMYVSFAPGRVLSVLRPCYVRIHVRVMFALRSCYVRSCM